MTLLDPGMVSCGTCKFIRVEMQDEIPELLEFAGLAVWKVCSAQSPAWLKARCFLPHIYPLWKVCMMLWCSSVCFVDVYSCYSASVQRDVAGSNCLSMSVSLLVIPLGNRVCMSPTLAAELAQLRSGRLKVAPRVHLQSRRGSFNHCSVLWQAPGPCLSRPAQNI